MWPMLAMAGGSALLGHMQGEKKRQAQEQYNQGQAEITRYSPWTGMRGQTQPVTEDGLSTGMQAGFQGAMLGKSLFGGATKPEAMNTTGYGHTTAAEAEGQFGMKDNGLNNHLNTGVDATWSSMPKNTMYGRTV